MNCQYPPVFTTATQLPPYRRATGWLVAMAAAGAIANPQAPQVVSGQATFASNGSTLTITNSPGAVINWQSFGINRGELTRFVQQNAASAVLNRVSGTDPSRILGALQSNGRVFLINPNGIVFGKGSQVDVAGLVVSSLKLSDQDFQAGRLRFGETPGAGEVRNEGNIRTAAGGQVVLVAPRVENSGLIEAPNGVILLAAGRSVEISDIDRPSIRVEIANSTEEAVNVGTLIARHVSIYGGLVRNSGTIQANSAVVGENGKVTLRGKQAVVLAPGSVIEANGPSGGTVLIESEGSTQVQGSVSARALLPAADPILAPAPLAPLGTAATTSPVPSATRAPTTATPAVPAPAAVPVIEAEALPVPGALVAEAPAGSGLALPAAVVAPSASLVAGAVAPSSVALPADPLVPQRPLPQTPALPQAPAPGTPSAPASGHGIGGSIRVLGRSVAVGDNARLDASGPLGGGEILVGGGWQGLNPNIITSNFTYIASTATLYANADLRGNGGLVVVWANDSARIYGRIAARGGALGGDGGNIETSGKRLLDVTHVADASAPKGKGGLWLLDPNNVTISTGGPDTTPGNPNFVTNADSSTITVATIKTALDAGISVTITTSTGGANSQAGDITLSNAISTTSATDVSLTLSAHNNINVNAGIGATGTGKLNLVLNANSDASGGGTSSTAQTLALNGGSLTVQGGNLTLNSGANIQSGALITSAGTSVTLPTSQSITFNGITLGSGAAGTGNVTVGNNATLNVSAGGLVLAGGNVTLASAGSGADLVLAGAGNQQISGTGEIIFGGTSTNGNVRTSTGTLVIDTGVTIHGSRSGTVGTASLGLVNNGTIHADASTQAITVTGTGWVNNGTLRASTGTLVTAGSWSSTGGTDLLQIDATGNLNLGGTYSASSITGNVTRSAGSAVNLTGALSLGGSYDLNGAGNIGSLFAYNGTTIQSGTLVTGGTTSVTLPTSQSITFNGITLGSGAAGTGNVTVGNNATLNVATGGLVLAGGNVTLASAGSGADLVLAGAGNQQISGTGEIIFGGTSTNGNVRTSTGTLVIDTGVTIHGSRSGTVGTASLGLVNNGTIHADASTQAITVTGTGWINNGTLRASTGTLVTAGSWSSTGGTDLLQIDATGNLNLGGTYSASSITGNVTRSAGSAVNLTGALTLGGSYDLNGAGNIGSLFAYNGTTIQSGTLVTGGTTSVTLPTSQSITFNGITLGSGAAGTGNVTVGNNATLNVATGGLVLAGGNVTLASAGSGADLVLAGAGNQQISGTGEIIFGGTSTNGNVRTSTGTLVIDTGVTIHGSRSGTVGTASLGLVNNGTIHADASTQAITVTGTGWVNNGTLRASTGTLVTAGSWSSTGGTDLLQIDATGNLNLGGTYSASSITGNVTRSAGSAVNLTGALSLGGSYDLNGAGNIGSLFAYNGTTIQSGTLVTGGTTSVTLPTSQSITFNGITLGSGAAGTGNVTVGNNATLNVATGGLVLAGGNVTLASAGSGADLVLAGAGNQQISGTGEIIFGGTSTNGNVRTSTGTLVIDTGVTIHGSRSGTVGTASLGLVNNGTIHADASTQAITVTGTGWVNNGTLRASTGTLVTAGSWSSTGGTDLLQIDATGNLNLGGTYSASSITGNVTRSAGSAVNLTGALSLGGSYDLNGAGNIGSLFAYNGTTIQSGTLVTGGTTSVTLPTSQSITFNGITLGSGAAGTGNVTVGNNATLNVATGGLVLAGGNVTLASAGSGADLVLAGAGNQQISGTGEIIFGGTASNNVVRTSTGTLEIGASVLIHGSTQGGTVGSVSLGLANHGTIDADVAGKVITITGTNWTNDGSLLASGGSIVFGGSIASNTGTITVASGTTLNLSGTYNTMTLGTFIRGAGSIVNLTGSLTNTGSTLDIDDGGVFSTGGLNSVSGTITGGTIISGNGRVLTLSSNPTFNGVTLGNASKPVLTVNGSMFVSNGLTLANGASITKDAGIWYWSSTGTQVLAVAGGGTATLSSAGGYHYAGYGVAGQTLEFGVGLTQSGNISVYDSSAASVINRGTLLQSTAATASAIQVTNFSNAAGATFSTSDGTTTLSSTTWSNAGTLNVSGGIMNLSGTNASNTGGFNLSGGTLNLGGNLTTPVLGSFVRTGGLVNITGVLNNVGNTLDIDDAGVFSTGGLNSVSGTITGGTIISGSGRVLTLSSNPTFNGVTLGNASKPVLTVNGSMFVSNGLTLANGASITKDAGIWYWNSTGTQVLAVAGGGTATLSSAGGYHYAGYGVAGQTLEFGVGLTQSGNISVYDSSAASVINRGTLLQSTAATASTIQVANFSNAAGATFSTSDGTTTLNSTTWSNAGTLNVSGGIMNLSGTNASNTGGFNLSGGTLNLGGNLTTPVLGSFVRTGGLVNITGVLNNVGNTLDIDDAGVFSTGGLNSVSGTITGGTIISGNGRVLTLSSNPTFNGVTLGNASKPVLTVNGSMFVSNGLTLANGASVTKDAGIWYWSSTGTQVLAVAGGGTATLSSAGGYHYAGYGVAGQTLEFGVGLTQSGNISVYDSSAASVINRGTLLQSTAATASAIQVTNFSNAAGATFSTSDGTTTLSSTTWSNAGTLNVSGGIMNLSGTNASNTGGFNLSGGTLNLGGNLTTPVLGSFVRTGGLVNITGVLNNVGNTLDIDDAGVFSTGGLNSVSGTITGGTIISGNGRVLTLSSNPTFNGVTLGNASKPVLTVNGSMFVSNGLTLANGASITKDAGIWYWSSTGTQVLAVAGGGTATLSSAGGYHYAGYGVAGQTLEFGVGLTQSGNISVYDSSAANVINRGTLLQSTAATASTIQVTNFSNAAGATFSTSDGTTTLNSTTWSNAGTLNVSGGIMNLSGTNASNTGGFNLSGGTLNLGGNLTTPVLGSFVRTGGLVNITGVLNNVGNTLDIDDAGVFSTGGLNSVSGTITGGTIISGNGRVLTLSSNPTFNGVTLGNASKPVLTVNGSMFVSNGLTLANGASITKDAGIWYWSSTGTQVLAVAGGGTATLSSAGGYHYAGYGVAGQTLEFGVGLTQSGNISVYDSSAANVINRGTLLLTGSTALQPTSFVNNGTITVQTGSLSSTLGFAANAGTINVAASASFTRSGNASFANNGLFVSGGSVSLGSGTFTNNGTLRIGASPGFTTIAGNLTLAAAGTLEIEISGYARGVDPGYDAIQVNGNATVGGNLHVVYLAPFTSATVGDNFLILTSSGLRSGSFLPISVSPEAYVTGGDTNSSVLQRGTAFAGSIKIWKTDSSGNWTTATNWSGDVLPGAGDTVIIDRGLAGNPLVTVNGAAVAGRLSSTEAITITSGSLDLSGPSTISGPVTLSGGSISGTGNLTLSGSFNVTGSSALSGTGVLTTQGTTTISMGAANGNLSVQGGKTWVNEGTLNLAGDDFIYFGQSLAGSNTLTNAAAGTINLSSSNANPFFFNLGTAAINNAGTFNSNAAGTHTSAGSIAFNNSGTFNANAGTFTISGGGADSGLYDVDAGATVAFAGGTRDWNTGVSFAGAGTLLIAGATVSVNNPLAIAAPLVSLSSGSLGGNASLTLSGSFNVTGSSALSGTGVLTTQGTTTISMGAANGNLSVQGGKTWVNEGTLNLAGDDFIYFGQSLAGSNTLTNAAAGTINLSSSNANPFFFNLGTAAINNAGTFNSNAAGTHSSAGSIAFNNSGSLNVNAGTLQVLGTLNQTGTIQVGTGAVLSRPGGFTNAAGTGLLTGSGSFDVTGGTLTNAGTIRPDGGGADATGTLGITGGFAQTGLGTLELQAEGIAAGQFDKLAISGTATLSGSAAVSIVPASGYVPQVGQSFDFVSHAGSTGSFTINAPAFAGMIAGYGGTTITFTLPGGCVVDICWIGASGDWSTGSNWSTGSAPTAGQRVRINVSGSQLVTMSGGSFNVLDVDSDESLVFSGGSLLVTGAMGMGIGTTLGISGGALTINGSLSAPVVNLSLGSLGGSGSITVGTDFNQTGGTFNPSGNLDLTRSLGAFNFGTLATSGTIRLATLGAHDINLGGSVQATNAGLAANVAAINVSSGGAINLASAANLTANTSGAISLSATGPIDLKVNDFGGNGSANAITAVGNVSLNSGASIARSDGNTVGVSGAAVTITAAGTLGALGGAISANSANAVINASGALALTSVNATSGAIDINGGSTVSAGPLSAGGAIAVDSVGAMTLGTIASGNGVIALNAAGAGGDINLNGTVTANNTGLTAAQAGLSVVAGRDILLASSANLSTTTSGAIVLQAARNVDLKLNDFGGNGSANAVSAVGNLDISATSGQIARSDGNTVGVSGAAVTITAAGTLGALGGAISANSANAVINASGALALTSVNATSGAIDINGGSTVSAGPLSAGGAISVDSVGAMTLGTIASGNGVIALNAVGAGGDINLNGTVTANNTGLTAAQPGLSVVAGRDILLASSANLSTTTSGAIVLQAARNVDLKLNDFGGNGSANAVSAVGNLDISATSGQIARSDGNSVSLDAANLALTAGTNIGALGGAITASVGNIAFNAPGSVSFTALNASGANGSINITSSAATVTGGTLSAGQDITLNLNSSGSVSLGAISAGTGGNGIITLSNAGTGSVNLNGNVQTSNAALAANVAAINVSSGGAINLASAANLTANTSGAISLSATGPIDLKVNDFGGNGSANAITAAGNVSLNSGASIARSDGNTVGVSGAAVTITAAAGTLGALGGSISANSANAVINASGALALTSVNATSGAIDINGGSTVSAGPLSAGGAIAVDSVGAMTLGTIASGNGVIALNAAGAGGDINLNGTVTANNTGLTAAQAGLSVVAGRDILLASSANLSTTTSGAIVLQAARNVDLKLNDFGGNGSANTVSAVGNLDISATSGQIARSDSNGVTAAGKAIALTFSTAFDQAINFAPVDTMSVTRSVGDLNVSSINAPALSFNAPAGNVVFASGSVFGGGPITVGGSGNAVFGSGAVSFNSALTSNMPLAINGASVAFNAAVSAPALTLTAGSAAFAVNPVLPNVTLGNGTMTIASGSPMAISGGTWDVGPGGVLNLPAQGASVDNGASLLVNGGAVSYGSNLAVLGALGLASGSLSGSGPINVTGSVTKTGPGSFALANTLDNHGSVNVAGGNLVLNGGGTHDGAFTSAAGATLDFQAGTHGFGDGTVFSGSGAFDGGGVLNVTGTNAGLQFAAGTSIDLNAMAFGGSGKITNLGTVTGVALSIPGDFVNGAGATANLTDVTVGGSLFNSGNFTTGGTVTVAGTQAQQLGGVMTIPAGATLDMSNAAGVFSWQDGTIGGLGTLGFSGGGTFLFAGTGDRVIDGLNFAFNNLVLPDGSLTLQSGSLTLTGATVLPAGVALNLFGGTLTNNGTLDVAGSFSLTGGAFAGGGSLTMSGGSLSLPAGNAVAWTNSGVLTNTGTLNLADSTITNAIDNLGTINLGSGLTFSQAVTNTGTISAQAGTSQFSGGLDQNAGGNIVLNGGNLQGNVNLSAGSISGSGTVNGNVVIGTASMAPGFSPGSIIINGDLTLGPSSVLTIEIGGLAKGSGYDWIKVNGTASLAGTLNVSSFGGFVPVAGSSFTFLNFTASTGAFAAVNLPPAPNFLLASAFDGLTLTVPAPAVPASSLLGGDPVSVAIERLINNEEIAATLASVVPLVEPEDKREIEVEGCR